MKFDISRTKLVNQLQMVSGIISPKNSLKILDNVIFDLQGSSLSLTAADSETLFQTTVDVENAEGEGKVGFDAKLLLGVVSNFPEQPITFDIEKLEQDAQGRENNGYKLTLKSQSGVYSFVGINTDDFVPYALEGEATQLSIPSNVLLDAIADTAFATGTDSIRPTMMALCFDFKPDGLIVVGTDAHRLAKYKNSSITTDKNYRLLLSKKPALLFRQLVGKYEGDIALSFDDKRLQLQFDNVLIVTRLVEGQYPNYEGVIPGDQKTKVTVSREMLANICKRISVFETQVKISIANNELELSAQNFDFSNSGEEKISCVQEGDDLVISFKSALLGEMLNVIDSPEVVLSLCDTNRAGLLFPSENKENEELTMLLMPMYSNE